MSVSTAATAKPFSYDGAGQEREEAKVEDTPSWKFAQCFGDKNEAAEISEADVISAVQFDATGDFLASGDRAGRVVMFERNQSKSTCEYKFYTEFQSHEPEFDYLKSQEINERISQIAWCPRTSAAHLLLTANEKTIKLWRVKERTVHAVLENNSSLSRKLAQTDVHLPLILPKLSARDSMITAHPRRTFGNVHAYHINSVSPCADGDVFLSADDLRINMWHYGRADEAFNMVDIKPERIENLLEVITRAAFHPKSPHLFTYATSKGAVLLCDMRTSSVMDRDARLFDGRAACSSDPASKLQLFGDIISSVSDVAFSPTSDRLMATRDYLTVKLWDTAMERKPMAVIPVHDYIRPRLCELYENDAIFDKFELAFSGRHIVTGSYHNFVRQLDPERRAADQVIHSDKSIFRTLRKQASLSKSSSSASCIAVAGSNNGVCEAMSDERGRSERLPFGLSAPSELDLDRKILQLAAHPGEQTLAVAATSNLFIFSGVGASGGGAAQAVPSPSMPAGSSCES